MTTNGGTEDERAEAAAASRRQAASRWPEVPLWLWGPLVREARLHRNMTQPQLGRRAGVSQQSISRLERGEMCPHDQLKLRLAYALGVPVATLFPWPDPLEPPPRRPGG